MITILEVYESRRRASGQESGYSYTGEDFEREGLSLLGGCGGCGESLAAYNGYPTQHGCWGCAGCAEGQGFETVAEFEAWCEAQDQAESEAQAERG